jgi:hypothetical protein
MLLSGRPWPTALRDATNRVDTDRDESEMHAHGASTGQDAGSRPAFKPVAAVHTLEAEARAYLLDSFTVSLSTELRHSHDLYPPGAQDYSARFSLRLGDRCDWPTALGEVLPEPDKLEAQARDVEIGVGWAQIIVAETFDFAETYEALNARNADLAELAALLLKHGEEDLDLFVSRAALVNFASIEPEWRDLRLGLLGTGLALGELSNSCSGALLTPMEPGMAGTKERAASRRRLMRYWGTLGFREWHGDALCLDLTTTALENSMTKLSSHLNLQAS